MKKLYREIREKQILTRNKRGQLGAALGSLPQVFIALLLVAVVAGATYLGLAGFTASTTNAKAIAGINNITGTLDAILSFSNVWGVMIGVGVMLVIILGAVGFFVGRQRGFF